MKMKTKVIKLKLNESYNRESKLALEVEPAVTGDYTLTLKLDFK